MSPSPSRVICLAIATVFVVTATRQAAAQRLLGATDRIPSRIHAPGHVADAGPARRSRSPIPDPVGWQVALDRTGFSPGVIDGIIGSKTRAALRAFQAFSGLKTSGEPDGPTRVAMGVGLRPAVVRRTLTSVDANLVAPTPRDWMARSEARFLGYRSLADLAAERGHCTLRLLRKLNRGMNVEELKAGDSLLLPNVEGTWPEVSESPSDRQERGTNAAVPRAASLEVDLEAKRIRVLDAAANTIAMFNCSIARDRDKRPTRPCHIKTIVKNPVYLFDPAHWPEVHDVDRRLNIPPGPRNPVGLCWIGLTLPGYGMHGTPDPEMIGKTGSHGCFRLTNWDALRLAGMVRVGMDVRFVEGKPTASGRSGTMSTLTTAAIPRGR
ncbi:MAG: L,D-transpeptidase [Phycisphaerae bacterium]